MLRFEIVVLSISIVIVCFASCNSKKEAETPVCEPITLRIWHTESDPTAQAVFTKIEKDFEAEESKKHGCAVDVQTLSISWGAMAAKLSAALESRSEPDLAHLEPFMTYSLFKMNILEPIDDVVKAIEAENGKISVAVRDLQKYGTHHYGIAYAVGSTFYAYRKDWASAAGWKEKPIEDWEDILALATALKTGAKASGVSDSSAVVIPGASPFFIDQLTVELLASAGGSLFGGTKNAPQLESKEFISVLEFLKKLSAFFPKSWHRVDYQSQFELLGRDEVGMVLVTYARALKALEKSKAGADDNIFAVFEPPPAVKGKNLKGYSTIDAEDWVIFKRRPKDNRHLAKKFLKKFYENKYYMPFCKAVPLHLGPIFENKLEDTLSPAFVQRWASWGRQAQLLLSKKRTRPIFIASPNDEKIPYLMRMEQGKVISDAVMSVILDDVSPESAAKTAQQRALKYAD